MKYHIFSIKSLKEECAEDKTLSLSRQISLWSKQMLRKIIQEEKGLSFDTMIDYGKRGKPFFKNNKHVHFSISHTKDYVAICLSNKPVGIDIESLRKCNIGLSDRFFHKKEAEYLSSLEGVQRDIAFTKIWTLKESYVKCIGEGIANNFKSFYLVLEPQLDIKDNTIDVNILSEYSQDYGLFIAITEYK